MLKSNGGPVFPVQAGMAHKGLSLLDFFAAHALAGITANPNIVLVSTCDHEVSLARDAYALAEEMLKRKEIISGLKT